MTTMILEITGSVLLMCLVCVLVIFSCFAIRYLHRKTPIQTIKRAAKEIELVKKQQGELSKKIAEKTKELELLKQAKVQIDAKNIDLPATNAAIFR